MIKARSASELAVHKERLLLEYGRVEGGQAAHANTPEFDPSAEANIVEENALFSTEHITVGIHKPSFAAEPRALEYGRVQKPAELERRLSVKRGIAEVSATSEGALGHLEDLLEPRTLDDAARCKRAVDHRERAASPNLEEPHVIAEVDITQDRSVGKHCSVELEAAE